MQSVSHVFLVVVVGNFFEISRPGHSAYGSALAISSTQAARGLVSKVTVYDCPQSNCSASA